MSFDPTLESVRAHTAPDWYEYAKLGIFVHWGTWTIPAFAPWSGHLPDLMVEHCFKLNAVTPYSDWFWNAFKLRGSASQRHHADTHVNCAYEDFRDQFEEQAAAG
jgi:alpha-L-fucosidase